MFWRALSCSLSSYVSIVPLERTDTVPGCLKGCLFTVRYSTFEWKDAGFGTEGGLSETFMCPR